MTLSNLPPGVSGAEPQINPTDPPNALPELITPEQCYHLGDVVKDHGKGPYIITGMRLEVKRWDEEWLGDDDTGHVVIPNEKNMPFGHSFYIEAIDHHDARIFAGE